tara:strand:- start:702 stop:1043 length:342 start_codon:yes stop_codon:yes gene_type:complete
MTEENSKQIKKAVTFIIPTKAHAELKARCYYDRISLRLFIREIIKGYINNDIRIVKFVNEVKDKKGISTKNRNKKNIENIEKGQKVFNDIFWTKEEIDDIYDVINLTDLSEEL